MNYMDCNCQDRKISNDGHFEISLEAYIGWGAGNNPEHFGIASQQTQNIFLTFPLRYI